jgi:hypothetical protein
VHVHVVGAVEAFADDTVPAELFGLLLGEDVRQVVEARFEVVWEHPLDVLVRLLQEGQVLFEVQHLLD